MAERLFDDDARDGAVGLAREAGCAKRAHGGRKAGRRNREIEDAIAFRSIFRVDLLEMRAERVEGFRIGGVGNHDAHARHEILDDAEVAFLLAIFAEALAQMVAHRFLAVVPRVTATMAKASGNSFCAERL